MLALTTHGYLIFSVGMGSPMKSKKDDRTLSLLLAKFFACPPCKWNSTLQNSRFFSKSVKKLVKRGVRVLRPRSAPASHARRAFVARLGRDAKESIFSVSPQSHSPFSASFQTFCWTTRALNTQKYGLFCSLTEQGSSYSFMRLKVRENFKLHRTTRITLHTISS